MRRTLVTMLGGVLSLALALPAEAAVDIPTSGRLVYTTLATRTDSDGSSAWPNGVATMAMDATDRQVLLRSQTEYDYYSPSWAPDGQWILFERNRRGDVTTYEAAVIRPEGGEQLVLAEDAMTPAWSPEGTAIAWGNYAYVEHRLQQFGITIAPVLDTAFTVVLGSPVIVDLPRHALAPSFSPDGQTVAFVMASRDRDHAYELWTVQRDGTNLRRIGGHIDLATQMFQWSPDGSRIAFVGEPPTEPWLDNGSWDPHLFIADPDGGNRAKVVEPSVLGFCYVESFSWAPSGDYLVVGGINGCLDTITPEGTRHRRLDGSAFNSMEGLSFSPDGSIIYGVAGQPGRYWPDLHAFAADGSGRQRLTRDQSVAWGGVQAIDPGAVVRGYGITSASTSAAVSKRFHKRSSSVVIAPADEPVQALAVAPLAADEVSPVLLTGDTLTATTRREIRRLRAGRAILAGPVTAQVASQLKQAGVDVRRVGGASPAKTAAGVARRLGRKRAFLVPKNDRWWAQAMAGSTAASLEGVAVLPSGRDRLPRPTLRAITRQEIRRVTVVGDESMVGRAVVRRLERAGVTVTRIGIKSRYRLATRLATRAQKRGTSVRRPVIVSGERWQHAITAGSAASARDRVLLMAPRRALGDAPATQRWISRRRSKINKVDLVGGPRVVRPRVETQLERRVGD